MNFPNFSLFVFPTFQLRKRVVFVKWDVGARKWTLMSISDELGPSISQRKMERTRSMREEMDGKVFVSRQYQYFSL